MARQKLTVQQIKSLADAQEDGAGSVIAFSAAIADGFYIENDGQTSIRVKTSGTITIVTIPHPGQADGLAVEDLEITLGATDQQELAFLPPGFNQPYTSQVWLNFSAITGVTVAAVSYRR
jgi:hypothetical protein